MDEVKRGGRNRVTGGDEGQGDAEAGDGEEGEGGTPVLIHCVRFR